MYNQNIVRTSTKGQVTGLTCLLGFILLVYKYNGKLTSIDGFDVQYCIFVLIYQHFDTKIGTCIWMLQIWIGYDLLNLAIKNSFSWIYVIGGAFIKAFLNFMTMVLFVHSGVQTNWLTIALWKSVCTSLHMLSAQCIFQTFKLLSI